MEVRKLPMTCDKCKVAATCPRKGVSPMQPRPALKRVVTCQIVGGYGRTPVKPHILSAESRERMEKDGPCLTLAEVPSWDEENNRLKIDLVKVFSQPIKHPRETVPFNINLIHPKGGGGT
jgi:hypothetical protein